MAVSSVDSAYLRNGGYLLGERINSGSFSTIHSALQVSTADVVAVKLIDLKNISTNFRTHFLPRELANIQSLDHPNIIKVHKIVKSDSKVYIVMDYAYTNLRIQIEQRTYIAEDQARKWFRQLASSLEYLHRRGVAHRDIKIENILIDIDGDIKLCDFGFSKLIERRSGIIQDSSTTFCGSLGYCAPEILLRTPYDPWKTDIWSLGVVLYKMVFGGMPFGEGNDLGSVRRIAKAHKRVLEFPQFPKTSVECQTLIRCLLTVETERRITLFDIAKSKWINPLGLGIKNKTVNAIFSSMPAGTGLGDNDLHCGVVGTVMKRHISQSTPSVISRIRIRLPLLSSKNKNKRN